MKMNNVKPAEAESTILWFYYIDVRDVEQF